MRLDPETRVLEAAERQRAVAELIEQQRRLQATVPMPQPEPPDAATAMAQMTALMSEAEGVALGWLQRLGAAIEKLVSAHESAGWPQQYARQLAIMMIEDLATATARAAGEAARLEQGADVMVAGPVTDV